MSEPNKTSPGYPAVLLNSDSPIVSQPAPDPPAGYYRFNTTRKPGERSGWWDCFEFCQICGTFLSCFRTY